MAWQGCILWMLKWVSSAIEVSKFWAPKQMSICIMYTYIHILVHMLLRGFWPMFFIAFDGWYPMVHQNMVDVTIQKNAHENGWLIHKIVKSIEQIPKKCSIWAMFLLTGGPGLLPFLTWRYYSDARAIGRSGRCRFLASRPEWKPLQWEWKPARN